MPRRTAKQAVQMKVINQARRKLSMRYAFRMRPFILQWEAEGMSQRDIVDRLNCAGASVPSEYSDDQFSPAQSRKTWSLVQYQRFRKLAEEAAESMAWWAKRTGAKHTRPFGDGRGLFMHPEIAGLLPDINRPRQDVEKIEPERPDEFGVAEAIKPRMTKVSRLEQMTERFLEEARQELKGLIPPRSFADLGLPNPEDIDWGGEIREWKEGLKQKRDS